MKFSTSRIGIYLFTFLLYIYYIYLVVDEFSGDNFKNCIDDDVKTSTLRYYILSSTICAVLSLILVIYLSKHITRVSRYISFLSLFNDILIISFIIWSFILYIKISIHCFIFDCTCLGWAIHFILTLILINERQCTNSSSLCCFNTNRILNSQESNTGHRALYTPTPSTTTTSAELNEIHMLNKLTIIRRKSENNKKTKKKDSIHLLE